MKKLYAVMAVSLFVFVCIGVAYAAGAGHPLKARYAGAQPTGDESGNVTIPNLPNGKLTQVYLWNDCNGDEERPLGPQTSFKLPDPCSSFSFSWTDSQGNLWWQMVTPSTKPGGALKAIYHPEGYKYGLKSADVNSR